MSVSPRPLDNAPPVDQRRIRLVQVTHGLGIGGMERVILDLCRELDPSVYETSIYCTHVRGDLADEAEALGIKVYFEHSERRLDHWMRPLRLYRHFRKSSPDIVHTQHAAAFQDAALASRFARVPVLIHTDHSKHYPTTPRRHLVVERLLARLADRFCAVSEHTKADLVRHESLAPGRTHVVYNGYDFPIHPRWEDRAKVRTELGVGDGEFLIGSVGRLEWQKGYDLLMEALPRILHAAPHVRAIIVGGGTKKNELSAKRDALGLESRVHLTGWRRDAPRFLTAFDLFVMPSRFEGMPIALLEAMASGLPVLATSVGGIPEMIEDGISGRLVPEGDVEALSRTALDLIEAPDSLRRLGSAARARYKSEFRVASMVQAYDRMYRELSSRHIAAGRARLGAHSCP